jgi:hypothetical protein
LPPVDGVHRDYLVATTGSTSIGVQLHQPAGGTPFIVTPMPLPDKHLTGAEVADAVLSSARSQLPGLFRARK